MKINSLKVDKLLQLFLYANHFLIGELDPERMGSGIQYGNSALRKNAPQKSSDGNSCEC